MQKRSKLLIRVRFGKIVGSSSVVMAGSYVWFAMLPNGTMVIIASAIHTRRTSSNQARKPSKKVRVASRNSSSSSNQAGTQVTARMRMNAKAGPCVLLLLSAVFLTFAQLFSLSGAFPSSSSAFGLPTLRARRQLKMNSAPQDEDPFAVFGGDDEDEDDAPPSSSTTGGAGARATVSTAGDVQRDDENGPMVFHKGTEEALLQHVKNGLATAAQGNAPQAILDLVDDFCFQRHWMMHVGVSLLRHRSVRPLSRDQR
jgi:hypothetical protein